MGWTRLDSSRSLASAEVREAAHAAVVQDLWFAYRGGRFALRGINLRVDAGSICMVLGPSGSGKTTLLKAVKGLLRPQEGSIRLFGAEAAGSSSKAGREIAYIPQHLGLVQGLTAIENVMVGALGRMGTLPSLVMAFPRPLLEEARGLLEVLGIGDKAETKAHALSGGERQRVAIARALMQRARLVLADELVSQLDPVRAPEVMEEVRRFARQGTTFIVTCHELALVARFGDRAVFLREGEVVYEGDAAKVDIGLVEGLIR